MFSFPDIYVKNTAFRINTPTRVEIPCLVQTIAIYLIKFEFIGLDEVVIKIKIEFYKLKMGLIRWN